MVFVKVRETYDLHTTENKMTVIAVHTPKPDILKRNYPGLLMQCKAYRPYSCDVRVACASVMPLDPLGIGTEAGDVAPEDVFNPILYKATSNFGMSQIEARIAALGNGAIGSPDVDGETATVDVDSFTGTADEFNIYYSLLSNTHEWKHASPQSGFSMSKLKPLVWEILYNVGDQDQYVDAAHGPGFAYPNADGTKNRLGSYAIRGNAKPMPFINTTSYSLVDTKEDPERAQSGYANAGFPASVVGANNCEVDVPYLPVVCGAVIIPPSRLHSLYFRMVVEWTIEFSSIRPLSDIVDFGGLGALGGASHYQNYSYESTKAAITGSSDSILENDSCMVASNAEVKKVM